VKREANKGKIVLCMYEMSNEMINRFWWSPNQEIYTLP